MLPCRWLNPVHKSDHAALDKTKFQYIIIIIIIFTIYYVRVATGSCHEMLAELARSTTTTDRVWVGVKKACVRAPTRGWESEPKSHDMTGNWRKVAAMPSRTYDWIIVFGFQYNPRTTYIYIQRRRVVDGCNEQPMVSCISLDIYDGTQQGRHGSSCVFLLLSWHWMPDACSDPCASTWQIHALTCLVALLLQSCSAPPKPAAVATVRLIYWFLPTL